ncbi:MAG: hypothetical protein AB4062_20035 [Crocosphaera sp.]
MTIAFTPDLINSLKSNLYRNIGSSHLPFVEPDTDYGKYWFQILILEKDDNSSDKFKTELFYGSKEDLEEKFLDENCSFDLPTKGVEVDTKFVNESEYEYPTVRFLLQCRRLSQILTYTWLEPDNIEEDMRLRIELTKLILDKYNILPKVDFINSEANKVESMRERQLQLKQKLLDIEKKNPEMLSNLILPESMSYRSISLALLLCGQAYYHDKESKKLTRICESIFSTYESIWEYALKLSWDTFLATRIDISQAGNSPKPPYTEVTMGYPPKPNSFSLKDNQIENWVKATEHFEDENNDYPFYPKTDSPKWDNKQLEYVNPPYPYIPLSCF